MLAVMAVGEVGTVWYLARRDPALLQRRLHRASSDEESRRQEVLSTVARVGMLVAISVSAVDHRMGWSATPTAMWALGDALIAVGMVVMWLAFRANTFAAATVQVTESQKLVSHGPYASVRHPMYSGFLVVLLGIPLALDSWWGLVPAGFAAVAIVLRLLGEERVLEDRLAGYREYRDRVRYRVAPLVW